MRYPASEKLEIIRLVEQSHLPARRTLEKLGVSRATFYRGCGLYQTGGPEALEDRSPKPERVWNRIPDNVRGQIVQLALDEPELSPQELATRFTDSANSTRVPLAKSAGPRGRNTSQPTAAIATTATKPKSASSFLECLTMSSAAS
jgi:transposase-like protein